jgi:WD40 repeat protein
MKVENSAVLNSIQKKVSQPGLALELSKSKWKSITFNNSGKQILVKTESGVVVLVDGYDGAVTDTYFGEGMDGAPMKETPGSCFTADGNSVMIGNADGSISCWDAVNGTMVKTLKGHVGPVSCIESNPKYAQFASSCTNVALWLM